MATSMATKRVHSLGPLRRSWDHVGSMSWRCSVEHVSHEAKKGSGMPWNAMECINWRWVIICYNYSSASLAAPKCCPLVLITQFSCSRPVPDGFRTPGLLTIDVFPISKHPHAENMKSSGFWHVLTCFWRWRCVRCAVLLALPWSLSWTFCGPAFFSQFRSNSVKVVSFCPVIHVLYCSLLFSMLDEMFDGSNTRNLFLIWRFFLWMIICLFIFCLRTENLWDISIYRKSCDCLWHCFLSFAESRDGAAKWDMSWDVMRHLMKHDDSKNEASKMLHHGDAETMPSDSALMCFVSRKRSFTDLQISSAQLLSFGPRQERQEAQKLLEDILGVATWQGSASPPSSRFVFSSYFCRIFA